MKSLIGKSLAAVILIAASAAYGYSQTRSVEHDLSPFEAIEASDGFKVSITRSDSYGIKLTVDDALESYVESYVKAGVLHIGLDGKNLPKDVKKQYKGRNTADPTLVAVVYMPVLKSLTLNDDSEFYNSGNQSAESFTLVMNGNSKSSDLKIVSKTVSISLEKNAKLTNANVTTEGDLTMRVDGKAVTTLTCASENLNLDVAGSSDVNLNGSVEKKVTLTASGGAKVFLGGGSEIIEVTGKGTSAKIDASTFKTGSAIVSMTGISLDIAPESSLELDLGRGAEVSYAGDPAIKIVKIQNASVLRK